MEAAIEFVDPHGAVACPTCKHPFSTVRLVQKTRRRRVCMSCGQHFTTYEKYATHIMMRGGHRLKEEVNDNSV